MNHPFGMPGPGGSLGQCALCGNTFLQEILLHQKVKSFVLAGSEQMMFGHDQCLKDFEGKQYTDLPSESPLRQAYEKVKNGQ